MLHPVGCVGVLVVRCLGVSAFSLRGAYLPTNSSELHPVGCIVLEVSYMSEQYSGVDSKGSI